MQAALAVLGVLFVPLRLHAQCSQSQAPVLLGDIEQNGGVAASAAALTPIMRLGSLVVFPGPRTTPDSPLCAVDSAGALSVFSGGGTLIGVMGGLVYFQGIEGGLWRSDGTATGTTYVGSLPAGWYPGSSAVASGAFLYVVDDALGRLWVTDGSYSGFHEIPDANTLLPYSGATELFAADGGVYFSAQDAAHGRELWFATPSAATLVADISPGAVSSSPRRMVKYKYADVGAISGTALYCVAQSSYYGGLPSLIRIVRDSQGTHVVGNGPTTNWALPPVNDIAVEFVTSGAGRLLVGGGSGLVSWDGDTTAGAPGTHSYQLAAGYVNEVASNGFFVGLLQAQSIGRHLYKSSLTMNSSPVWIGLGSLSNPQVRLYGDFGAGAYDGTGYYNLFQLGSLVGRLSTKGFASPCAASDGSVYWTDGILHHGTQVVPGLSSISGDLRISDMNGDSIGFLIRIGANALTCAYLSTTNDLVLVRTDGSPSQTQVVKIFGRDLQPRQVCVLDEIAYIVVEDSVASSWAIYRTDGTPIGTNQVATYATRISLLTRVGSKLLWGVDSAGGMQMFTSDGTPVGTHSLATFSNVGESALVGNVLFFVHDDGVHGLELWRTDGTPAGTALALDLAPGANGSYPHNLSSAGGRLVWFADDGVSQLARMTDGTPSGTVNLVGSFGASDEGAVSFNGDIYYLAASASAYQLYRVSTGSNAVVALANLGSSSRARLIATSAGVCALVYDWNYNTSLWSSDGSPQGTRKILLPGVLPPLGSMKAVGLGDRIVFPMITTKGGWELASLCMTSQNVDLLADITDQVRGPRWRGLGSGAQPLGVAKGRLVFSADDAVHGSELWSMDPGATTANIGQGSGIGTRVPSLSILPPHIARTLSLSGSSCAVGSIAVPMVSAADAHVSNILQCNIYLDVVTSVSLGSAPVAGDRWSLSMSLPGNTSLVGLRLMMQAVIVSPNAIETTQGVECVIGS